MRLLKWHELLDFSRTLIKVYSWMAAIILLLALSATIVNADLGFTVAICTVIFFIALIAFVYFVDCLYTFD